MASRPCDIYAEQLFPLGHGHPLWIPEPNNNGREIDIGDVGWLKDGDFRSLFNSMKPEDDPVNAAKGVPLDFEVFNPRNISIGTYPRITQPAVCSRSVRILEESTETAADA